MIFLQDLAKFWAEAKLPRGPCFLFYQDTLVGEMLCIELFHGIDRFWNIAIGGKNSRERDHPSAKSHKNRFHAASLAEGMKPEQARIRTHQR